MGSETRDNFANAPVAELALPGSYGISPGDFSLPLDIRLGRVRLQVSDIGRSLDFYERVLGLRALERDSSRAVLGAHDDTEPLVELTARRGAMPAPTRGQLGLFHYAILLPDRASLGRFAQHLGDINARAGSADHLVSEAFYLQDPDNLGIEVYADRPRSAWLRTGRELKMATDPIDFGGLLRSAGDAKWTGMPGGTVMGHVHLHVGEIATASSFYSDALGFDRIAWGYPGALFMSAGGYHHHLGTNIWAGRGARAAGDGDARLLEWTIRLPDSANVAAVGENLERSGYSVERDDVSVVTRDPWGTQLRIGQ
ncbi:MAG: VOC family protein [Gemmatimonadaceae bacterium]